MRPCSRFKGYILGNPIDLRGRQDDMRRMNRPAERHTVADGKPRHAFAQRLDDAAGAVSAPSRPGRSIALREDSDARIGNAGDVCPCRAGRNAAAHKANTDLAGIWRGQLLFDQLRRRGVVKVVLPDAPPVRDINQIARTFELPLPTGDDLKRVKALIASRGLGVFLKYLQKAYAVTKKQKEELSWAAFAKVANGYLALANMKTETY